MNLRILLSVAVSALATATSAQMMWGGAPVPERDSNWSFSAGAILNLEGSVDELSRGYYTASGQHEKQSLAESYTLEDFGVDGTYPVYGLAYAKRWEFFAFRWNLLLMSLSADAVAKRDYYIGIGDEIDYNGVEYDHMKIAEGTPFSVDFTGFMTDLMFSFTPFTVLLGEDVKLTPRIDLGLVAVGGQYEIDAGTSTGTTVYQNPPVDFVVGGNSESLIGIGAPQLGGGLELRVGPDDDIQWISSLGIAAFAYDGRTDLFTSAEHRKKNADITYLSAVLETGVHFPLPEGRAFTIGGRAQFMTFEGDITSDATSEAELLSRRERFDKRVDFEMLTAMLTVGFDF